MSQPAEQTPPRNRVVRIKRRAYVRYPLICQPATLHCGSVSEPCIIRNISAGGLMAQIYKAIALAGEVIVEFGSGARLSGTVAWTHEWDIGIAFATPVDVDAVLSGLLPPNPGENRRAFPRTPVRCPAQLRLPSRTLKARINDISPAGASLETLRPIDAGARATLTLPDLPPMAGTVRWTNEKSAGLRFDQPLPQDVLDDWLTERRR